MVACICHSPLHHQKPDFEGQSVIKASSYLLPFVFEAHRESLPRSCETSARRLSAESDEVYSTADLPASAAHTFPSQVIEPRRLHSELRTSRCVFELHHRQDFKLPFLCYSSSSSTAAIIRESGRKAAGFSASIKSKSRLATRQTGHVIALPTHDQALSA